MLSMMNAPESSPAQGGHGSTSNPETFLAKTPLFHDFAGGALHALVLSCHAAKFPAGRRLVTEGAPGTTMYVLRGGWVKVTRSTAGGGTILFDVRGTGQIVGLTAAADGGPYLASATALRDLEAIAIPSRTLVSFLGKYPQFWRECSRIEAQELRETTERQIFLSASVPERLACVFEHLAESLGSAEGAVIRIPKILSRQEIAEMACTTPETAIRILSRWKRAKILVTEKDAFAILNPSELFALAENCGWHRTVPASPRSTDRDFH